MCVLKTYPRFERDACCSLSFLCKDRQGKDKPDHGVFSLQDSTLNAPQQTLNCMHSLGITGNGLAKTISITLLLQCVHWLSAVKSLDALGPNWLLRQGRMLLLPFFIWLLPSNTASGKCNLPSHLSSARLMGFASADSFGIVFNNSILLILLSDYFSQSKYSLRRWRIIRLVCFPMKTFVSIFSFDFLLL